MLTAGQYDVYEYSEV